MKSKILLVNPPAGAKELYGDIFGSVAPSLPPLGIAYIAAVLIDRGFDVVMQDYAIRNISIEKAVSDILEHNPDFLGVTSTTLQYNTAMKIIDAVKAKDPSIKIVLGGSHFTALPVKSFEDIKGLDYGIVGEGEYSFCDLIEGKSMQDIEGLVFRKEGDIFYKDDFAIIKDLNSLPYPARSLLPLYQYLPSPVNYKKLPSTNMITSRGCAGKCDFCIDGSRDGNVRFLSSDKVFEEIKLIKEKFGISDIAIKDDAFMQDKERIFELCNMLIEKNSKIHWNCMSRVDDVLDERMLAIMKKAGCYQVGVGVETFNAETLKNHNKVIEREKTIKAVELLKKARIESRLFFIVGFPEERDEDILNTFRFAEMLDPDIFQVCVLIFFPGTKLREDCKRIHGFNDENWDSYLPFCPDYAPTFTPYVPKQELTRLFYKGYSDFYSKPRRIIRNLWKTARNLGFKRTVADVIKKALFLYKIRRQSLN